MELTEMAGFAGAVLAGTAYMPQITHLVRARCSAGISRVAFGIWLLSSVLMLAHAVAIEAGVFIFLSTIQIAAIAVIIVYSTRYADSYCETHLPVTRPVRHLNQPAASFDGWKTTRMLRRLHPASGAVTRIRPRCSARFTGT
jgi:uncharacterized protein with PQ loop repeat